MGLMKFKHLGNMTKAEIDTLVKILEKYKKQGQFRAFWSTFNESVNLMASKEVVIESMWSPAVALLVTQGVPVRFAAPPEGFRGWDGIFTIVEGIKAAGKAEPAAIQKALWGVKVRGVNGDIAGIKQGPAGQESAQNGPSGDRGRSENGKGGKN